MLEAMNCDAAREDGTIISAEDDMRHYALMEHSPESLEADEICRGRLPQTRVNNRTK
jgi:hypothetical protein